MKRIAALVAFLSLFALAAHALLQGGRVDRDELAHLVDVLDIDPGEVVADVGAGDGRFSVAIAREVGPDGRVYATEVDPNDLKQIRDRVEREGTGNVTVVEGDQEDTGLPPACCDAILLRRVYHHFQNPDAMQGSLREALRADGLLLIVDFDTRRRWNRPEGIPDSRGGHGISKSMLVEEMQDAGFELVDDMRWDNGDYALVFRVAILD